jgi:Tol biopolymer transport system component
LTLVAAVCATGALFVAPGETRPIAGRSASDPALVAYETDPLSGTAGVWLTNTDGTDKRELGTGDSPRVAPNGAYVAAVIPAEGEDGSAQVVIYPTSDPSPADFVLAAQSVQILAISPDSKYLAIFVTNSSTSSAGELAMLESSTGALTPVARGVIAGASFNPNGSDELVYGRYSSSTLSPKTPVNLYAWSPAGSTTRQLTHDGHSLNPVWGAEGIAYDHERLRRQRPFYGDAFQIWLLAPSGSTRQLTNVPVNELATGLVPVAFSSSGTRLLAEYEQQDVPEAYTVLVPSGRARRVLVPGYSIVLGVGISAEGGTIFAEGFAYGKNELVTIPFGGGRTRLLTKGRISEASWQE